MLRGGAFNNDENTVRCADRNSNNDPDNANDNNGFRVVLYQGGHLLFVLSKASVQEFRNCA